MSASRYRLGVDVGGTHTDLVLLVGGPFFEDIWFAPGGHIAAGASLLQIEASAERLALNNRLDAGIVGDIAVSLRALTEALTAKASADFRRAAQNRNASLAELQAKEKEAYRARVEKSGAQTSSRSQRSSRCASPR